MEEKFTKDNTIEVDVVKEKELTPFQEKKVDLYLEQIKYITAENQSIQEKFLSGVDVPLGALGVLVFYIETNGGIDAKHMYLLLPFLCFSIIFNLIKYSIRMFINNGYLKHLEKQINDIMDDNMFFMNRDIRDTSTFKNGYAVMTSLALIPIYIAISFFLGMRFIEVLFLYKAIPFFCVVLVACLACELLAIAMMLWDVVNVQKEVIRKIDKIIKNGKDICK